MLNNLRINGFLSSEVEKKWSWFWKFVVQGHIKYSETATCINRRVKLRIACSWCIKISLSNETQKKILFWFGIISYDVGDYFNLWVWLCVSDKHDDECQKNDSQPIEWARNLTRSNRHTTKHLLGWRYFERCCLYNWCQQNSYSHNKSNGESTKSKIKLNKRFAIRWSDSNEVSVVGNITSDMQVAIIMLHTFCFNVFIHFAGVISIDELKVETK